jgi:hypothetical protein
MQRKPGFPSEPRPGVDLSTVPAGMQKNRKNRETEANIIEKTIARWTMA